MKIFVLVKITNVGYGAEEKILLKAYKDEMAAHEAVMEMAQDNQDYLGSYEVEEIELC